MYSATTNFSILNNTATRFLDLSQKVLSANEFTLLSQILLEWHASPTFNQLCSQWEPFKKSTSQSVRLSEGMWSMAPAVVNDAG